MDFEKLDVWKRSARMSADIYRTLRELKDWGFKDQITQAYIGVDIGYIPREAGQGWIQETREIAAMISGLITCLQNDKNSF